MPFLDAKALETDPEGLAFLRAVLKPAAKRAMSDLQIAAAAEPRQAFAPPRPPQGEAPPPILREATAAAPAP
jgi:hypothetical protein